MKQNNTQLLKFVEKMARPMVQNEKRGNSFCPVIWHQPKRPQTEEVILPEKR